MLAVALTCILVLVAAEGSLLDGSKVVARVGMASIRTEEFRERYEQFLFATGTRDNLAVRRAVLQNMIDEILLLEDETSEQLNSDPKFVRAATRSDERVLLAYLKDQEIYSKISVSEQEARVAFARVNERIAVRHLFTDTEELAKELYELLRIGVDFQDLAQSVFTDSTLRHNGGYLGYFTWGDMDPAFEDVAYALKVGEISRPVQTQYGYSIIRLEDRIPNPLLTESEFVRKRAHTEQVIRLRKKGPAERSYRESVLPEGSISFDNDGVNSILSALPLQDPENTTSWRDLACVVDPGDSLSVGDIVALLRTLPSDQVQRVRSPEMARDAIRGLVLNTRLLRIALAKGYDTVAVVRQARAEARKALYLHYRMDNIIAAHVFDDSVVQEFYLENRGLFTTEREIDVQEIIVAVETTAVHLSEAIRGGAEFSELAFEHSLRRWSAENGGDLGFIPVSRLGDLRGVLWETPIGEMAGPLQVGDFYGLFRVLGKRNSRLMAFEDAEQNIRRILREEESRSIIAEYIDNLRRAVDVDVDEEVLRSLTLSDRDVRKGSQPPMTRVNNDPKSER